MQSRRPTGPFSSGFVRHSVRDHKREREREREECSEHTDKEKKKKSEIKQQDNIRTGIGSKKVVRNPMGMVEAPDLDVQEMEEKSRIAS